MRILIVIILSVFLKNSALGQQDSSKQAIPRGPDEGIYIPDKINSLKIEVSIFVNNSKEKIKQEIIEGTSESKHELLMSLLKTLINHTLHAVNLTNYREYRIIINDTYMMAFTESSFQQIDSLMK